MTGALQSQIEEVCKLAVKHDLDEATRDIIHYSIVQSAAYFLPRAWTPEELRALPVGTLIADADGDIWIRNEHGIQMQKHAGKYTEDSTSSLTAFPPQHITHLPEEH